MREKPLDEINQRDNNRSEMLKKFQLTRQSRRAFVTGAKTSATTFLNKYPRLKDMKEAVSLFYTELYYQCDRILLTVFYFYRLMTNSFS